MDSPGNTIDPLFRANCDIKEVKRFSYKALKASHTSEPRLINIDSNPVVKRSNGRIVISGAKYGTSLDMSLDPQALAELDGIVDPRHGFLLIHVSLFFHGLSFCRCMA
jgi:hypothetical protein